MRLTLPPPLRQQMIDHALAERPNECCGIVAGRIDGGVRHAERLFPLVNELASPTRYLSEPRSILSASKDIDRLGLTWVAVYHSHPTSPPIPSATDLANNFLGDEMIHVIVTLTTDPPTLRGWRLFESRFEEVTVDQPPV